MTTATRSAGTKRKAAKAKAPKSKMTRTPVVTGDPKAPSFSTLLGEAITAYIPTLRGMKATEFNPPDDYLAGKALQTRQRSFRSTCIELANRYEADPVTEKRMIAGRLKKWAKAEGHEGELTAEQIAQGVREVWGPAAMALAARLG